MTTDNKRVEEIRKAWGDGGVQSTHWEGCETTHHRCAVKYLLAEVERLEAERASVMAIMGHPEGGKETLIGAVRNWVSAAKLEAENARAATDKLRETRALLAEKDAEIKQLTPKDNRCPFHPWMSAIEEEQ